MARWPWRNPRPGVDMYGRSPLWDFAAQGELSGVEDALASGSDPTAADKDGYTALHVAGQNGYDAVVAALIGAGADVNAVDRYGNGPLWTASHQAALAVATEANLAIVSMLLAAGADPHHANHAGRSPTVIAMRSERLRNVFLSAGVEVGAAES